MDKTDQIVQQIDFSKLLNFAPQQVIGILNNLKTPILLEIFNKFPQLDKEYRVLYKKKIQNFLVPKDVLNEVQVETEQQLTGDVIREVKKTIYLSHEEFEEHIGNIAFLQDNESKSTYGVLRGLHYQIAPFEQSKLVRVVDGKVLDVSVDIRRDGQQWPEQVEKYSAAHPDCCREYERFIDNALDNLLERQNWL